MTDSSQSEHLDPADVARFVDGTLSSADRARVTAHVADCDACRAEVLAVSRIIAKPTHRRVRLIPIAAAAAAAAAAVLFMVRQPSDNGQPPLTREPMISTTVAPAAVAPRGTVTAARTLVWTSVPNADVYRLTLFDDAGRSLWETQTADTTANIPSAIPLREHTAYFWRVEAQTGWNRWVASDLIEFSIGAVAR